MKDGAPKTPEGIYVLHAPTDVATILGGEVPRQRAYDSISAEVYYDHLASSPLFPQVKKSGEQTDYFISGPPMRGRQVQHLFHFAAPSKVFGIDYNDTQNDWDKLYSDPRNAKRLAAHRTIQNWEHFEPFRLPLRTFIRNDLNGKAAPEDVVVPVIHLTQDEQGLRWNFSQPEEEQTKRLQSLGSSFTESGRFLPVLGPAFVAAFSPDLTEIWGDHLNYRLEKNHGRTQDMGTTQAFALSLALKDSLLESPILRGLVNHCRL